MIMGHTAIANNAHDSAMYLFLMRFSIATAVNIALINHIGICGRIAHPIADFFIYYLTNRWWNSPSRLKPDSEDQATGGAMPGLSVNSTVYELWNYSSDSIKPGRAGMITK